MDAAKNMAMFIPQPSDNLWDYANSPSGGKTTPPNESFHGLQLLHQQEQFRG